MKNKATKRWTIILSMVLIIAVLFTSCDFLSSLTKPETSSYWSTFKKNMLSLDFPSEPNYALMSEDEWNSFRRDMAKDPYASYGRAYMKDGSFYYSEKTPAYDLLIEQEPSGEWWGSLPVGGTVMVLHLTNVWPDHVFVDCLPGKPGLKFWGEQVDGIHTDHPQWWGMFIGKDRSDMENVMLSYYERLRKAGWDYKPSDGYDFFQKDVTSSVFATIGFLYDGAKAYMNVVFTKYGN